MGPIATPSERNLLLSQRAEGANKQMIAEKCKNKRRKCASTNPKNEITISTSTTVSKSNVKTIRKPTKNKRRKLSSDESPGEQSSEDELPSSSEETSSNPSDNITKESNSDDSSGSEGSEYDIDKFTYLKNKLHYDDEENTVYKTTRVAEENGFIVVYRKKQYSNGKFASKEDRRPIFAKDVVEYTNLYDRMQTKK